MKDTLIIGSRSSKLALIQAELVRRALAEHFPHLRISVERIATQGDRVRDVPLARIGGQGIFTKEIEAALLERRVDLAVHSLKDLPTALPDGLVLAAVSRREDPHDVLLSRTGVKLKDLPPAAAVGTSSLRRKAQLLAHRRDLEVRDIRGNLDTRLRKLTAGHYDAIVLARAGLLRAGMETPAPEILPYEVMLPAVGQGALGVETRDDDGFTRECVRVVNDDAALRCVSAERSFLRELEGGCQTPVGAVAEMKEGRLVLRGMVSSTDGSRQARAEAQGPPAEAEAIGVRLARRLLDAGGRAILQEIRRHGA